MSLRSERDKPAYFWSLHYIYLLRNYCSRKYTPFTYKQGLPLSASSFILTTAPEITPLIEKSNISAMTMHFDVKLSCLFK